MDLHLTATSSTGLDDLDISAAVNDNGLSVAVQLQERPVVHPDADHYWLTVCLSVATGAVVYPRFGYCKSLQFDTSDANIWEL
jgi:hypothetical protein